MVQGKVLVTDATGETGRATVDELLARGHQVRALAHAQDERSKRLQELGAEVVYGDLLDIEQVRSANNIARSSFDGTPLMSCSSSSSPPEVSPPTTRGRSRYATWSVRRSWWIRPPVPSASLQRSWPCRTVQP
jgi:NAD(P)-dependent dehydrogenase (short-subunit alcohol dehydrogenase family)